MINIYIVAAFWFLSALISTVLANRLKISNALLEIIVGAIIGFIAFKTGFTGKLALDAEWMNFIAGVAAIMLTFLAGSELNPDSLKSKFKEITIVGLVGFFAPFIGATLIAYFILHWGLQSSLLTGIALSTTSMAVVYAVMIEYGFNKTSFGKSTFKKHKKEKWYYTLLMSTGLTFGTISALYGLTNNIISREQYSIIVGVVIASAVIPTLIANKFFLPAHLIEKPVLDDQLPDIIKAKK